MVAKVVARNVLFPGAGKGHDAPLGAPTVSLCCADTGERSLEGGDSMRRSMLVLFALFLSGTPVSAYQDYGTWFQSWCKQTTRCLDSERRKYYQEMYPEWFSSLSPEDQQIELQVQQNRKLDAVYDAVQSLRNGR